MPRAFALREDAPAPAPSASISHYDLDALVYAFGSLGSDVVRDVARASDGAKSALELLRALSSTGAVARELIQGDSEGGFHAGAIPDDVRDLIFGYLSPKDAARAACACREFRVLVRGWRRNARRLDLPRMDGVLDDVRGVKRAIESVGSIIRAYPNLSAVNFKRLGETLRKACEDDERAADALGGVLTAIAANNASGSIDEIDFTGCGEWLEAHAVVELAERCRDLFPDLASLSLARAKRLEGDGLAAAMRMCGSSIRELRLTGCVKLDEGAIMRAIDIVPGLRTLDLTGCLGLRRLTLEARDAPKLEQLKAVNCSLEKFVLRRASRDSHLKVVNVADCSALRFVQVQSESMETLSVAGCRSLETFNVAAPRCETLLVNKCASLREVTEVMNVVTMTIPSVKVLKLDSCKSLTTNGFAQLLDMCSGSLVELSAEGCLSVARASVSSPNLLRCALSGCSRLEVARVSSEKCRSFIARSCKALTEVRFDRGAYELEELDVRNSSALRRIAGARQSHIRRVDVQGCSGSLDISAQS